MSSRGMAGEGIQPVGVEVMVTPKADTPACERHIACSASGPAATCGSKRAIRPLPKVIGNRARMPSLLVRYHAGR